MLLVRGLRLTVRRCQGATRLGSCACHRGRTRTTALLSGVGRPPGRPPCRAPASASASAACSSRLLALLLADLEAIGWGALEHLDQVRLRVC